MVQGLGFLSKKSWHTKNIANQEKVWMAEEREKTEQAKTAELAKQINAEREEEELAKLAGRGNQKLDRGIDWMYTGHHKDSETAKQDSAKQAEEYLLGKEFSSGKVVGDLDAAVDPTQGMNAIIPVTQQAHVVDMDKKQPASAATEDPEVDMVAKRNEAFRMRYEDPMFAVSLQAVRKEKSIEQRKELYEKAGISVTVGSSVGVESGITRKKERKERKRKNKEHKKSRRRRRSSSASEELSSYERNRKRRQRSRSADSREYSHRRRHHSKQNRRRRRSPSVDSYTSYDSRDRRRNSPERDFRSKHATGRRDAAKMSLSPSHRSDRRSSKRRDSHEDNDSRKEKPQTNDKRYGLQGIHHHSERAPTNSSHATWDKDDLGPSRNLLDQKRRDRELERQRLMGHSSRGGRPSKFKTSEERQAALRAMEQDAATHAAERDRQLLHGRGHDDEEEARSGKKEAAFLHEMSQAAHGVHGGHEISLSDRLRQNRNTNQRSHETFL